MEVAELETTEPNLAGATTITIAPTDAEGGTDLVAVHEGLPAGVAPEDNEAGWRGSLVRLAELVEGPER